MENKLQVRNLRISFRTSNGKVQAVRDISFDLAKGETLAIVGESGSGKSVTSKAILGILAGNSIIESGEIIYDGKDLLKISEEDFHKIRGDKIAMIFQDPMSSLNPIVRIGKQLTEAMLLKGKARQRESRSNFNTYLKNLEKAMIEADASNNPQKAAQISQNCKKFDKFEFKHIELESAYNKAFTAADETADDIEKIAFEFEKGSISRGADDRINDIVKQSRDSVNEYVVKPSKKDRVYSLTSQLKAQFKKSKKTNKFDDTVKTLYELRDIMKEGVSVEAPNFFCMGYYLTFSDKPLPDMPIDQLNAYLHDYIDKDFMLAFISDAEQALKHSSEVSCENMKKAIAELEAAKPVFAKENLDRKECLEAHKHLSAVVSACVDKLDINKDSLTFTFAPSLKSQIDSYFHAIGANKKAIRAHEKDQRKFDRIVAKGKKPNWEVADAAVTDLELIKANIARLIDRLIDHYDALLANYDSRNFDNETVAVIDYLKANASGVVDKVTRRIAKHRAIKLMEEVGIAEPHKRYKQYPFEFSGGMRQRIVIAIALAANPDILICDEPTTALDVTIQAQILELINNLKEERKLSVIFITHDLGVVANMADRVAVMYAGKIVEYGTSEDIFYRSAHPYTWALLSSMPDLDTNEKLEAIPGTPPNMIYPPKGDAFAPRNRYAMAIDFERQPPMFKISDTHFAATWLLHPDAPKVDPPKAVVDRIARMKSKRGLKDE